MSDSPRDMSFVDVMISVGTQILAVGAIQCASFRDLKVRTFARAKVAHKADGQRVVATERVLLESQSGKASALPADLPASTPSSTGAQSVWGAYKPMIDILRAPLAVALCIGLFELAARASWQGTLDVACVIGVYTALVLCVDIAAYILAKGPIIVRNPDATTPNPAASFSLDTVSLHHPFVSLAVPAAVMLTFSKENMGAKTWTVAAVSIAALVTLSAKCAVSVDKLFKMLCTYNGMVMLASIFVWNIDHSMWENFLRPSPWVCDALSIFPAAIPAVLPGLLVSRALRHDYRMHVANGKQTEEVTSSVVMGTAAHDDSTPEVESATTERSTLIDPLPEFPVPTYRAALFAWIGSTSFTFALGALAAPSLLKPGREVLWPFFIVLAVHCGMVVSARRAGTLVQLLEG